MKNWKKYSIEFLSIFVAVISAFALNNWNDNRRDHIAGDKILTEIHIGLEKDLKDIQLNESGHKSGIDAVIYFRDLLANKTVSTESLMHHYLNLTRDFVSIQNTSGYETLKSKGLEVIENDSLRTRIVSLYEYDYNTLRKLEEEYYELQFQENYFKEFNRIISPQLLFNEDKLVSGIHTPLDVVENDEKLLLTLLLKIQTNRNFILHYYSEVKSKIDVLIIDIKEELNQ